MLYPTKLTLTNPQLTQKAWRWTLVVFTVNSQPLLDAPVSPPLPN